MKKENIYYFSASQNAFYPSSLHDRYKEAGTLPHDLVEVSDEVFNEFSHSKSGYIRSADERGFPAWIEIPPLSQDEINAQKEAENIEFLASETKRVNDAIAPLDDAIEFEMATDEEIVQHKELRKYRLLLSRVPNQDTWPLNPVFPTCPDFFSE